MTGQNRVIIRNGLVVDHVTESLLQRDISISDGKIEAITEPRPESIAPDSVRVVDASNSLVVPGFVNAHTHSYGMLARHLGAGLPLEPWMMYSWAITGGRTAAEVYLSAQLQGVEALLTGTTTVMDHLGGDVELVGEAARAYADLGIRAAVAPMISDIPLHQTVGLTDDAWSTEHEAGLQLLTPAPAHELLDQTRALHARWHHAADGLISVLLGPSAPQRCSAQLLEGCAALSADLGVGIHTHLLESRVQSEAPLARLSTLERHGLLNDRLLAAHGVWTTEQEMVHLAEANASLAHNPQSNLQLGSGVAQLPEWRAAGVNAALGTDGANCGGSLNMLSSMRLATVLHRSATAVETQWESPWSVLDMATINGAVALGLESVGRIHPGWTADLAIFPMTDTPFFATEDPLAALILSAISGRARHVLVRGHPVVEEGQVTGVHLPDLAAAASEARRAIVDRREQHLGKVARAQQAVLARRARQAQPPRPIQPFSRVGD